MFFNKFKMYENIELILNNTHYLLYLIKYLCSIFFFLLSFPEKNSRIQYILLFLSPPYTYERWFSRDKKKCSAFSHDIQRLVSDQARCKRSVFKLFIRIDMGQSLRTNASCDLARREGKRKKKKKRKRKRKVFQRHEISWSLTSFHVIRYTMWCVL